MDMLYVLLVWGVGTLATTCPSKVNITSSDTGWEFESRSLNSRPTYYLEMNLQKCMISDTYLHVDYLFIVLFFFRHVC